MLKAKTKVLEDRTDILPLNRYAIVFKSDKSRARGIGVMGEVGGVRQGVFIEGKDVDVVYGFHIDALKKAEVPFYFFTRKSENNNHDNHKMLRK